MPSYIEQNLTSYKVLPIPVTFLSILKSRDVLETFLDQETKEGLE